MDTLAFGYILPTTGWIRDFNPLETCAARRTRKKDPESKLSESLKIIIFNRRSKNYSMIVATLPDPTVRPPSRYQTDVLRCANGDFPCDSCGKIRNFRCVRVVFGDFVIMILLHPNIFLRFLTYNTHMGYIAYS